LWEYEVCGYHEFLISRTDGKELSEEEKTQLEMEVSEDLNFDYSEDELAFWFDDSFVEGCLLVTLQDIYDHIDEDED
jgi:hypothetical protein